ncbi:ATPase WRNIP1 isoform X2 [Orussus abietinus]|uniref:ATPase WRNIP1 isoform X2 n=1 Tax=Orussus abietinus TaxID=222816 RepID=UPI0006256967|nr:ATPase WRNIP1 isoform X2 [Orussus abietinus]
MACDKNKRIRLLEGVKLEPPTKKYKVQSGMQEKIRPTNPEEYIGQKHILSLHSVLYQLIRHKELPSMILWGPPGCGKTTLAKIIACTCKKSSNNMVHMVELLATTSGIIDIKTVVASAIKESKLGYKTIVLMDEIHRFNKLQQDVFLPHVEAGTFTLIGTTTENPSYSLNSTLISRCRLFVLKKLSTTDSISILERAVKSTKGKILTTLEDLNCNSVAAPAFTVDEETIKWLAVTCDGDIRVALSSLNWAIQSKVFNRNAVLSKNQLYPIEVKDLKEGLQEVHVFNDKENNLYYDMISALHKCIRANKANAALYWLARIMADGHDPVYIAKRLVRISSEEVGLADIDALGIAVHTMHGCQMLGMPECDILLAQCVVYLARAPKSRLIPNALEIAHKVILNHNGLHPPVPLHMRCKPRDAQLMSVIETAKENSLKEENLNQNCLPPELKNTNFFKEESLDAE